MDASANDWLTQVDSLLASGSQSWLFGAGISLEANIPLMGPLTTRVFNVAEGKPDKDLLVAIQKELPKTAHIENILSQLGDYAAIAVRCESDNIKIGDKTFSLTILHESHDRILKSIAEIIRWGYRPKTDDKDEKIGTPEQPLVSVDQHANFVRALLSRGQAGLTERRRPVRLFSTNYDTLLEDALALGCFPYWDGFTGGALAFRSHRYGRPEPETGCRAHVIKLHGSIDWYLGNDNKVWRVRDRDTYPPRSGRILIYPQSTKYLATQRDPFAAQFDLFRRVISEAGENVLAICGYSFGDEHVNQEIELAVGHPDNKTTVLAFSSNIKAILEKWRKSHWGKRLYVLSEAGLYVGAEGPFYVPKESMKLDWWTFQGVTKVLNDGAESCVV
jgi:hypothetical protein